MAARTFHCRCGAKVTGTVNDLAEWASDHICTSYAMLGTLLDNPCESCGGNGVIYDADWQLYQQRWREARDAYVRAYGGATTALTAWYDTDEAAALSRQAPTHPEERDCPECRGAGRVPTDLGRQLLAFVRHHLHGAAA